MDKQNNSKRTVRRVDLCGLKKDTLDLMEECMGNVK